MNLKIDLKQRRLYNPNDPDLWHVTVSDPEAGSSTSFTARSQAEGVEQALKWGGVDGIEITVLAR